MHSLGLLRTGGWNPSQQRQPADSAFLSDDKTCDAIVPASRLPYSSVKPSSTALLPKIMASFIEETH